MSASSDAQGRFMARRRAYGPRIYRGDYFILRHLTGFLQAQIERLVAPTHVVADVGCGEQPLRSRIEAMGARYVGLDIVQNADGTVDHLCSITALSLPSGSADVVLCTEVLEHVSDTGGAFAELARVLRPGGWLIVTTPFAYPLHEEPHDFVRLTPHQVRSCASKVGLAVDLLETAGNELEVIATVLDNLWSRMEPRRLRVLWGICGFASRLVANPIAAAIGAATANRLPRKYFLSTFAVLRKPA